MAIPATGNYAQTNPKDFTTTSGQAPASSSLSMDNFMNLLAVQLQNQDMSNPMSNAEMMQQLTSMSTVQSMNTFTELSSTQYALSMMGKEVKMARENSTTGVMEMKSGEVVGINLGTMKLYLKDDLSPYGLGNVMEVGKVPEEKKPEEDDGEEDKKDDGVGGADGPGDDAGKDDGVGGADGPGNDAGSDDGKDEKAAKINTNTDPASNSRAAYTADVTDTGYIPEDKREALARQNVIPEDKREAMASRAQRTSDKTTEARTSRAVENATGPGATRTVEKVTDKTTEKTTDKAADKSVGSGTYNSVGRAVEPETKTSTVKKPMLDPRNI